MSMSTQTRHGGDEIPEGTFHGGDEIPEGTFHGGASRGSCSEREEVCTFL